MIVGYLDYSPPPLGRVRADTFLQYNSPVDDRACPPIPGANASEPTMARDVINALNFMFRIEKNTELL